jgi:ABC-type enterochelin transport system substrate-binding protein
MNYEDKTNKELVELCEELNIDVDAKNPSKPNKAELITALEAYDAETEDFVSGDDMVEQIEEAAENPAATTETKAQKRRRQVRELTKKVRVIATSNADNQTKTDLITIGWGNDLIGHQNDRLLLGKPWHIRQGALDTLRAMTINKAVQNDEQNRVDYVELPAYNVQDLGLLSKEEYKAMADKQKVRDAAVSASEV